MNDKISFYTHPPHRERDTHAHACIDIETHVHTHIPHFIHQLLDTDCLHFSAFVSIIAIKHCCANISWTYKHYCHWKQIPRGRLPHHMIAVIERFWDTTQNGFHHPKRFPLMAALTYIPSNSGPESLFLDIFWLFDNNSFQTEWMASSLWFLIYISLIHDAVSIIVHMPAGH